MRYGSSEWETGADPANFLKKSKNVHTCHADVKGNHVENCRACMNADRPHPPLIPLHHACITVFVRMEKIPRRALLFPRDCVVHPAIRCPAQKKLCWPRQTKGCQLAWACMGVFAYRKIR